MTDKKKTETIEDKDLDEVSGGLLPAVLVGRDDGSTRTTITDGTITDGTLIDKDSIRIPTTDIEP